MVQFYFPYVTLKFSSGCVGKPNLDTANSCGFCLPLSVQMFWGHVEINQINSRMERESSYILLEWEERVVEVMKGVVTEQVDCNNIVAMAMVKCLWIRSLYVREGLRF